MTRTTKTTGLMLATGLATLALLQPAMALDAEAFVDRISAVYKTLGYEFEFGPATVNGSTVTVDGVTVGVTGSAEESVDIDTELTFTGVVETEEGGFTAERLTVPDVDTEFATDPVGHITVTDIVAEDIWLPAADNVDFIAAMQAVAKISSGPLSVTRDGDKVISIDGMSLVSEFTFDAQDKLETVTSDLSVNNIWADLSTVGEEEAEAGAVIEALGLTEINGNITQLSSWSIPDGRMTVDQFAFDFADVGALDIKLDLSGLTPAVMDKIYKLQAESMEAGADGSMSEEAQARQMMVGMELAQAIVLNSASIRYDDASLAGKMLDMFAAQSGADRDSFVEGIKAMVPALVGQAGIPALTDMVVPEVNAFLDNPQSFEVSVKPATPTSILVLTAAAANPASLIQALGLVVAANK